MCSQIWAGSRCGPSAFSGWPIYRLRGAMTTLTYLPPKSPSASVVSTPLPAELSGMGRHCTAVALRLCLWISLSLRQRAQPLNKKTPANTLLSSIIFIKFPCNSKCLSECHTPQCIFKVYIQILKFSICCIYIVYWNPHLAKLSFFCFHGSVLLQNITLAYTHTYICSLAEIWDCELLLEYNWAQPPH